MQRHPLAAVAACVLAAAAASASAQTIDPVILARTGVTAFNLPAFSTTNSATAVLNDARQVAVKINTVGASSSSGLFFGSYDPAGGEGTGGLVYTSGPDLVTFDAGLSDADGGTAVFADETGTLRRYTPAGGVGVLNKPLGTTGFSGLNTLNDGRVVARLAFGGGGQVDASFPMQTSGTPTPSVYASNVSVDASSPYSFLFTPDFADAGGAMATLAQLASGGNDVRRFAGPGAAGVSVAADTDAQAGSPYGRIYNGVSISDDGSKIAFLARLAGTSTEALLLYDDDTGLTRTVAAEGSDGIGVLDVFAPSVNDLGQIAFRGSTTADQATGSSVFLADADGTLRRLAGVGDTLETDLGLRQLGRRDNASSQGGAPQLNNLGDVVYSLQYFDPTNPSSVADGTLVLVSPAAVPEPAALGLLAAGGLLALRRRRHER